MGGVKLGVVAAGDVVSGVEVGFKIGIDEVGVAGVMIGTVVIGVVMSLLVVDIEEFKCTFLSSMPSCALVTLEPEQRKRQNSRSNS